MTQLLRVYLRTLGVEAARAFYTAVLGPRELPMFELHEQALARGARPHWLGCLEVEDVDAALEAFVQRGATSLGAKWKNAEGIEAAVVRDPGGAIIALARAHGPSLPAHHVVWTVLSTPDVERAKATYGELLDLIFHAPLDLAGLGQFHPFAWAANTDASGVFGDIGERPGVHPHWLFYFEVPDLEGAIKKVRAEGGQAVGPITLPDGRRVAACDDPQGAAFGLLSRS